VSGMSSASRRSPSIAPKIPRGRMRYVGVVRGRRVRVVVAVDKPGFVVTVHERKS